MKARTLQKYVIRKIIEAHSAQDAIRKEKKRQVDEVFLLNPESGDQVISGFQTKPQQKESA